MSAARASASSGDSASLMPPALPRPPIWTWAFTTTRPPIARWPRGPPRGSTPPRRGVGDAPVPQQLLALVLEQIHPASADRGVARGPALGGGAGRRTLAAAGGPVTAAPAGTTVPDAQRPGAGVGCRRCGAAGSRPSSWPRSRWPGRARAGSQARGAGEPRPVVWGFAENLHRDPATIERKLAEMRASAPGWCASTSTTAPSSAAPCAPPRRRAPGDGRDHGRLARPRGVRGAGRAARPALRAAGRPPLRDLERAQPGPDLADRGRPRRRHHRVHGDGARRLPAHEGGRPHSTILVSALSRRSTSAAAPTTGSPRCTRRACEGNFDAISVHPHRSGPPGEDVPAAYAWLEMAGPWTTARRRCAS